MTKHETVRRETLGGRDFEVRRQPDGVFWLLLWKDGNSLIVGQHFANAEVAWVCAEQLPKGWKPTADRPNFVFAESTR